MLTVTEDISNGVSLQRIEQVKKKRGVQKLCRLYNPYLLEIRPQIGEHIIKIKTSEYFHVYKRSAHVKGKAEQILLRYYLPETFCQWA